MNAPKLLFFGNEKLATGGGQAEPLIQNRLSQAGYDIEAVVTGGEVVPHQAQIAILAAYGKILPANVLEQFPLGIINLHPSLLPAYRGPTPIEQAILDGVSSTGVSIMRISAAMDAGPIYAQATMALSGGESKAHLAAMSQQLGANLLLEALPGIIDGSLSPQPQQGEPSYCPLIRKSDGRLDLNKPADRLEREIRAYLGWPGSFTTLGGKDVIITRARVADTKPDKGLALNCGDGRYLVIERLKPAGKPEMAASAFLAGNPLKP